MISVANLKDELNLIDPKVKEKLFVEFDEGANWMTRPDLLRLFTDTMPLWDSSDLSFFIGRLLAKVQKEHNIPELLQERYLRVFENYLAVYYKKNNPVKTIDVNVHLFHITISFYSCYYSYLIFHSPFTSTIGTTICSLVLSPKASCRKTSATWWTVSALAFSTFTFAMPWCSSCCCSTYIRALSSSWS